MRQPDPHSGVIASPVTGRPDGTPRNARVLLVDDDPLLLRSTERGLKVIGCDVTVATDGREALGLLSGSQFDVVVSDISMPSIDGLEMLRRIRKSDADVPVIFATAEPGLESALEALEHGAFRYLLKPVDPAELGRLVLEASQLHRLARLKREALAMTRGSGIVWEERDVVTRWLDEALEASWVAYQPVVSAHDGEIFGHEALFRTRHEQLTNPMLVIEAAERLDRLGEFARHTHRLIAGAFERHQGLTVLLNAHPRDFDDAELFAEASPLLPYADRVVIEVTERAPLPGGKTLAARVERLRERGFRLAIDDLGSGYAGLNTFANLQPELVKLDREIVRSAHTSPLKEKLVGSIASVCREMGILVVAEGIEEEPELHTAKRMGCQLVQGYLIGMPKAEPRTTAWSLPSPP